MRHFLLATMSFALSWPAAAQVQPISPAPTARGWTTPRRHFSFSPITFDLDYGNWAFGSHIENLVDCSNDRTYCLSSPTFSVAVPRQCADLAAGHWSVGDVHTEVLFRQSGGLPIHSAESGRTFYLGNAAHPSLLIEYDPNVGLKALYWDRSNRIDFMAMARAGRLESWLISGPDAEARRRVHFPRTTFDRVGSCRR